MNTLHVDPPQSKEWGKSPAACTVLKCRNSRLYEILLDLPKEDPLGIIETFVLKSPKSRRGTRLFELNSLRRWLNWKYEQAQAGEKQSQEVSNGQQR